MYICICIYIYFYMYQYVCTYVFIYIYICTYLCLCLYSCMDIYKCLRISISLYMCMYESSYWYVCMYVSVFVSVYVHLYVYPYPIYVYICIYMLFGRYMTRFNIAHGVGMCTHVHLDHTIGFIYIHTLTTTQQQTNSPNTMGPSWPSTHKLPKTRATNTRRVPLAPPGP